MVFASHGFCQLQFLTSHSFSQKGFIANNDKPFLIFMTIFYHLNECLFKHTIAQPMLAGYLLDKLAAGQQARYSTPYHN